MTIELDKSRTVEINLTERCNLRCPNCTSCCGVAPADRHMPLEVLQRFLEESDAIGKRWKRLTVTGGEPSLHPQVWDAIKMLERYWRRHRATLKLAFFTNGQCPESQAVIDRLYNKGLWRVRIRPKDRKYLRHFVTMNDAPGDQPTYVPGICDHGCRRGLTCGLGLAVDGRIWPCSLAYHIDRVFGFELAVPEAIGAVTLEGLTAVLPVVCKLCGAWDWETSWGVRRTNRQITSPSWEAAIKRYAERNRRVGSNA